MDTIEDYINNYYPTITFKDYFIEDVIFDNKNKKLVTLNYESASDAICSDCNNKSTSIQTRKYRYIQDIGFDDYVVQIKITYNIFNCRHCNKRFTVGNEFSPKGLKFSHNVYRIIENNYSLSVREISYKLIEEYNLKMSFDQINEYLRVLGNVNSKELELNKNKLETNIHITNIVDGIYFSSKEPIDYIFETIEKQYGLVDILNNHFDKEIKKYRKYPNSLFNMASLMNRMREQSAIVLNPYAITSDMITNKIKYNLCDYDFSKNFASGTNLRFIYDYEPNEIENEFNSILNDINNQIKNRSNIYILDATKIEVNKEIAYENASFIKDEEENKTYFGYKASALYQISETEYDGDKYSILVPNKIKISSISNHDINVAKTFITKNDFKKKKDKAYLIIDRGYTDIDFSLSLANDNIYTIIPAKKNSSIFKDALNLIGVNVREKVRKDIEKNNEEFIASYKDKSKQKVLKAIRETIQWDKNPIKIYNEEKKQEVALLKDVIFKDDRKVNVCVIRYKRESSLSIDKVIELYPGTIYYDNEYSYSCIYTTDTSLSKEDIINKYSKRMLIENQFRQLKQEWNLSKLYSKNYKYIVYHLMATFVSSALFQVFKLSKSGNKYTNETIKTVKTRLLQEMKEDNRIIISSGDVFNNYDFFDFLKVFDTFSIETKENIQKLRSTK